VFSSAEGFCAYVRPGVLKFIADHARRNGKKETIGLLCGRICIDPAQGAYTLIMDAGDARQGEFKSTEGDVQLLPSGHAKVRRRLIAANPDREVIGWYHTHPSYPPRFSHVDFREQQTWSDKDHIGIVYSGESLDEPFGVYRGPAGTLLRPTRLSASDPGLAEVTSLSGPPHPREPPPKPAFLAPAPTRREIRSSSGDPAVGWRKLRGNALIASSAMFAVLAVLGGIGFFQIRRATSSLESRLNEISSAKSASDKSAELTNSVATPSPTPLALSSSRNASVGDSRIDDLDRPSAKPLFSETRRVRQRNANRSQSVSDEREAAKRDKKLKDKKAKRNASAAKPTRPTAPGEQILPDSKTSPQASPRPK